MITTVLTMWVCNRALNKAGSQEPSGKYDNLCMGTIISARSKQLRKTLWTLQVNAQGSQLLSDISSSTFLLEGQVSVHESYSHLYLKPPCAIGWAKKMCVRLAKDCPMCIMDEQEFEVRCP